MTMENLEISNLWSSSTATNTFDFDISIYFYDVLYWSQMISSINKRLNGHCLICFWFMSSNMSIIRIKPIVLTKVYANHCHSYVRISWSNQWGARKRFKHIKIIHIIRSYYISRFLCYQSVFLFVCVSKSFDLDTCARY